MKKFLSLRHIEASQPLRSACIDCTQKNGKSTRSGLYMNWVRAKWTKGWAAGVLPECKASI